MDISIAPAVVLPRPPWPGVLTVFSPELAEVFHWLAPMRSRPALLANVRQRQAERGDAGLRGRVDVGHAAGLVDGEAGGAVRDLDRDSGAAALPAASTA